MTRSRIFAATQLSDLRFSPFDEYALTGAGWENAVYRRLARPPDGCHRSRYSYKSQQIEVTNEQRNSRRY